MKISEKQDLNGTALRIKGNWESKRTIYSPRIKNFMGNLTLTTKNKPCFESIDAQQ
jgi:hypothetical protein